MTMDANELRALADALEPMAGAPRFEDFDVPAFCAWVRACADAEPVARIYTDAEMVHRDERWGRVQWIEPESELAEGTLLYTYPAPAAPQAESMADSDADYWLRNRQAILDAIERAGFMLMSNASGFWLHQRGTTDAQAEPLSDERIAEIQRAAYERAAQECIETAAELRRCADGCTDGRYDWKADGADDCADAIRALGRQR